MKRDKKREARSRNIGLKTGKEENKNVEEDKNVENKIHFECEFDGEGSLSLFSSNENANATGTDISHFSHDEKMEKKMREIRVTQALLKIPINKCYKTIEYLNMDGHFQYDNQARSV